MRKHLNSSRLPSKRTEQDEHHTLNTRQRGKSTTSFIITITSLLIFIALVFFGFSELKPKPFGDNVAPDSFSSLKTDIESTAGDLEVDQTIALIQQGGPYPYPNKDGATFYNREGRLPSRPQGYYREYTVPTPGILHRGARRIVTGGNPPEIYYLTLDHYDSFKQLDVR